MEKQYALQSAAERLTAALDVIEQKFDTHLEEFARHGEHKEELKKLISERASLKSELNEARAQAIKLTKANQDIANRLDSVISSLKTVLG